MARKSKHERHGLGQARGHPSAQQEPTTTNDRVDAIDKAKIIKELVAPVFSFPFTATYISELEISDFEDTLVPAAETTTQTIEQDRMHLNHQDQMQYSSVTIERSRDQQSHVQRGQYSTQNEIPFAVWENQASAEEPFNDIGEMCSKSAGRQ
ncbi:hypothetical protein DL95DRAFT_402590 [Leptodontidium sp. 2 PMI_412]|nr:hypothetical protein DL95DRAFT_402590 [Leptodontidium sp. 2 PMI_412]